MTQLTDFKKIKEYGGQIIDHYFFIISSSVTIRRQQNYHLFFCGWGDNTLISNLNRMFYSGGKGNTLKEAFKILSKTVKNPYECYLLLDNHPNSPFKSSMKLRSNIFDKENPYFLVTDEILEKYY